ncbi:MAG: hypothetical protein IH840_02115 [Candidatus Heimdallarchaeota archaeon]|nr:hypothetical protein [Candidatus Heimdallarchaeota archaeon]
MYAFGGKYSRNSLDAIADALLGTKKIEHDLWFDEMSLVQMISYNVQDAKITYDLTAFSNHLTMHLIFTLMRIIKGTMSFINRGTISSWILNWIAFEHRKQKVLLPKSSEIIQKKGGYQSVAASGGKQYQGAIVLDPVPGTWWNVAVMDYTSLYPSVIEKYKLSYETMKCDHVSCRSNIVPGLKHWVCEISPGIMSSLVGYVREVRVRWFKPLTKSDDQQVATLANTIQAALKVLINASYGVFGNKKFVSHCPPVAESTTAYARHALRGAQEQAEAMGIKVLAGDTDSIFLHNMTKEQEMKLRIWSMVHLGIELGVDYHFRFLVLSNRKKNYFGITTDGKIITKGLQVKKSNTARFIRTTYDAITSMLSEVSSPDELENAKKTMVNLLQRRVLEIKESSISLDDLAQLTSMKKPFKDYQTNSQAVQIAVQNLRDNKHTDIGQGSQWLTVKVKKFRYTTRTSKFYFLPSGTDIFCTIKEVAKVKNLGEVDTKHYVEALENAFKPIFESFDIDWDDTMNGYADVTEYF